MHARALARTRMEGAVRGTGRPRPHAHRTTDRGGLRSHEGSHVAGQAGHAGRGGPGPGHRGAARTSIIQVTSTGLCGSDLHLYDPLAPFMTPGDIVGHEPMGIVRRGRVRRSPTLAVRRPRRRAVQHQLRHLLDVRRRASTASARPPRTATRHRREPVRLQQALRAGARRPGRATCGSRSRDILPIKVPARPAGRPVPLPLRRAAHRVAGRRVRRRRATAARSSSSAPARSATWRPGSRCTAACGSSSSTACRSGSPACDGRGAETIDLDRGRRGGRRRSATLTDGRGADARHRRRRHGGARLAGRRDRPEGARPAAQEGAGDGDDSTSASTASPRS